MRRGWDGSWDLNIGVDWLPFLLPVRGEKVPEGRMRGYFEIDPQAGICRTFMPLTLTLSLHAGEGMTEF
jgi:hypothetical protein